MMDNAALDCAANIFYGDRTATLVVLSLSLSPFVFTYFITAARSAFAVRQQTEGRSPPISPYFAPILGNLVEFLYDSCQTVSNIRSKFGIGVPVRLRLFDRKVYLISGQQHTQSIFKQSRDLTSAPAIIEANDNVFGSPAALTHIYTRDNTGVGHQPLPGSENIGAHNRIFHLVHSTSATGLSGTGLVDLALRFVDNLEMKLLSLNVGEEWVQMPDIYKMVQIFVFEASTTAIFGPHLFRINPYLAEQFWQYDGYLMSFFKKVPKWLIPKGFAVREKILGTIMEWHEFAHKHSDPSASIDGEYEEFFGTKFSRRRHTLFPGIDGMTKEGLAAQDLGLMWAANANIVPLLGWTLLDILMRPKLTTDVLSTIASIPPTNTRLNVAALCSSPLFQSIFSEELRLRSSSFIARQPITSNFHLGSYAIPKGHTIFASSWHEARNPNVWNQGTPRDPHLVEHFWAERFLVYPEDPLSGPKKTDRNVEASNERLPFDSRTRLSTPRYTTDGVSNSLFPFGGGTSICTGRFYAKQEAIAGVALFLSLFEIELDALKDGMNPDNIQPNMKQFAAGILEPAGKFSGRMRRRKS